MTRHYYGMKRIGLTMGIMSVCVNLGFAAGPPIFGWFADVYGNFTTAMIVYGSVATLATLTLLPVKLRYWISPTKRRTLEPEPAAAR